MTDVFHLACKYASKLEKALRPRLEELLKKHCVVLHDLLVTHNFKDNENDLVKLKVEVEIDISGYIAEKAPCLYWDVVYDACSEAVCQDEECEEELEEKVEKCVEERVEEYRNEYGRLPFEFMYERKGIVRAYVEVREIEDSAKLCIRDILVATFYTQINKHYLKEIIDDPEAIRKVVDRDTQYVVGELESILRALETLA